VYNIIILILCVAIILTPGMFLEEQLFWVLVGLPIVIFASIGVITNYYIFTFQFASKPNGSVVNVGACGWIYDALLWLPFIPFFIIRSRLNGGNGALPLDGTYLDEKSLKK